MLEIFARGHQISILNEIGRLVQGTGAQEWHIVSLFGDVTSPTTAVHYVSMTCSEHREALTGAPTEQCVHKHQFTVHGGSAQFATEQVGRLHYVTTVDGGPEAFSPSFVICEPVVQTVRSATDRQTHTHTDTHTQTHTHRHTHRHTHTQTQTFFKNNFLECGSVIESKTIKKLKSNFLTIAILSSLLMSLESNKRLKCVLLKIQPRLIARITPAYFYL